jgi:hypothetical protein
VGTLDRGVKSNQAVTGTPRSEFFLRIRSRSYIRAWHNKGIFLSRYPDVRPGSIESRQSTIFETGRFERLRSLRADPAFEFLAAHDAIARTSAGIESLATCSTRRLSPKRL